MSDTDQQTAVTRRGLASASAGQAMRTEQVVIEAMRAVEEQQRPGLLTLYFNGSNWLLYEDQRPRYLRNG